MLVELWLHASTKPLAQQVAQWNGLLPLNGIAMCQTKDFSNQEAGGEDDYNTYGN